ncbi:unnamed protein product [Miscanthus lutarioriparius]|uniref:HAT C-terminal dimerisation domain-containing protein n=1 Tax=Miscanthus lutarioriparius TaxID=422564 RepID=A0A811PZI1_9POAL|nr:unnamed protein product [Miscanthus lutarioriparius]
MAPIEDGAFAPKKGKAKAKTKTARQLLAPADKDAARTAPAGSYDFSAPPPAQSRSIRGLDVPLGCSCCYFTLPYALIRTGSRNKMSASQSISSGTCDSPATQASVACCRFDDWFQGSIVDIDTSCTGTGPAQPGGAPVTDTPAAPVNIGEDDQDDEEQAHLSSKRYKKCTSHVWKYFTKKKEVIEVDGKQYEQLWGYCNFARCNKRYRAEGPCGTTAFKSHLRSKHSIVEGQQRLDVGRHTGAKLYETFGEVMVKWYKKRLIEYYMKKFHGDHYQLALDEFICVVKKLYNFYASSAPAPAKKTSSVAAPGPSNTADVLMGNVDHDLEEFLYDESEHAMVETNELERCMGEPLLKIVGEFDILAWKNKREEYPILSQIVRDIMAVQVSTVASESAFSAAGRVVDPYRSRLDPEMVQALICTKDWVAAANAKVVGSIVSDLEVDALTNVVAKLKIEDKDKEAMGTRGGQ